MTGRAKILMAVASVVALIVVVGLVRDWFDRPPIEILVQVRPQLATGTRKAASDRPRVSFTLDRQCDLNEVQLYEIEDSEDEGVLIWNLARADDVKPAKPVQGFTYGQPPKGLTQVVPGGGEAPALQNAVLYRLVVETEQGDATKEFEFKEKKKKR